MFSKTRRGRGDHAGWAGQSFLDKGGLSGLLPGSGQLHLLGADQHQVVAGLGAGVAAVGQRQQAGLAAGGAGPGVAAVPLAAGVVAGGRRPAGLFAARRLGAALAAAGHAQGGRAAHAAHRHRLRTRVAASLVTHRGTLVVSTSQRSSTALVTRRAVAGATLPPALVSLAASGLWTFRVTQILFVTRHQLPVFTTPALLLHLLSASLTAPAVASHGAGVLPT